MHIGWHSTGPHSYLGPPMFRFVLGIVFVLFGVASGRPSPLSVPAATEWIGDDGNWSPFSIRVGSPPQWLSVLPNTRTSETWVIGRGGCDDTLTCRNERGGLFLSNESSTWSEVGQYETGYTLQFGQKGVAKYGYDNIALDENTTVSDQVIGIIEKVNLWVGSFGLGITDSNFTDDSKLSFVSSLKETNELIPSYSYGYTAGAYNRLKGVPGSLTLGGVDKNRFVPNNVSFNLTPDYLPAVSIQSIDMTTNIANKPVASDEDGLIPPDTDYVFTIDSSTPFFWFPEEICDAFGKALGLTYNETLQLYTYNASTYDTIAGWDLNFTFTLSDLPHSSNSVQIDLPFAALDHKLSYPFPNLPTGPGDAGVRYFPLRKANDSEQYTIGRAFLQEAYLAVDYERKNFSVSQAKFAADALTNMDIVEIAPQGEGSWETSSLSTGAKAGIGVGISVFVILVAVAVFFYLRRRKKPVGTMMMPSPTKKDAGNPEKPGSRSSGDSTRHELQGERQHPIEAPTGSFAPRFELAGDSPAELPGSDVGELHSESREFKDSEVYRLCNGVPEDQSPRTSAREPSSAASSDGIRQLPYNIAYVRPGDNSDSDHSSAFPSPLRGYMTSEGSHSFGVSPVTGSGEQSSSGSLLQASQASSPHPLGHRGTAADSISPSDTEPSPGSTDLGESPHQSQGGSSPLKPRRKFSWEE